jgi:hypothetical protein
MYCLQVPSQDGKQQTTGKLTLLCIRVGMCCDINRKAYKGLVLNPNSWCVSAQQGNHIHQNLHVDIK